MEPLISKGSAYLGVEATSDNISSAVQKYFSKGNVSTGLRESDVLGFIPENATRAMVIEVVPSARASALPITGSGKLAELSDNLQKAKNYSGAVANEVVLIPNGGTARVLSSSTSFTSTGTELTRVQVIIE